MCKTFADTSEWLFCISQFPLIEVIRSRVLRWSATHKRFWWDLWSIFKTTEGNAYKSMGINGRCELGVLNWGINFEAYPNIFITLVHCVIEVWLLWQENFYIRPLMLLYVSASMLFLCLGTRVYSGTVHSNNGSRKGLTKHSKSEISYELRTRRIPFVDMCSYQFRLIDGGHAGGYFWREKYPQKHK